MFLTVALLGALWSRASCRFGIENVVVPFEELNSQAYVHQELTRDACAEAGILEPAAMAVTWHCDYVDSYLYNPLFWASGVLAGDGIDRLKVSASLRQELEALHFDDLTSVAQTEQMWTRYLGGCVAGVVWAAQSDDVAMAHHVIGVTLHAIQDFYSHSSWVDDSARRDRAWHQYTLGERSVMQVYTASYETPEHLSQHPHGVVSFECSLLRASGLSRLLGLVCSDVSPLHRLHVCEVVERCRDAQTVRTTVLGINLPPGLVYVDPPGIALDSSWQAAIARQVRDIPDDDPVTAAELYAAAKRLAVRSSAWWLGELARIMRGSRHAGFWERVSTEGSYDARRQQFEVFSQIGLTFVATTPYPPAPTVISANDWYLRLQIRTSSATDSGTNGDVSVAARGTSAQEARWRLLDHGSDASAIVEHNDFSTGDVAGYVIGPFTSLPTALELRVAGTDVGDLLGVIWDGFAGAVAAVVDGIGDFLLSLIDGHANWVADRKIVWDAAALDQLGLDQPLEFREFLDGDNRGQYNVFGSIRRVANETESTRYRTFEIVVDRLQCWEESSGDILEGASDEPFLMAVLVNLADHQADEHGGRRVQDFRTAPISMDRRQTKDVRQAFPFRRVKVPRGGMLALALSVWESDYETASERDRILAGFAGKLNEDTQSWSDRFIETVGGLVGAAWKLGGIEVFAFRHALHDGKAATVLADSHIERWIEPGASLTLPLLTHPDWTTWALPTEYRRGLAFSARAAQLLLTGDLEESQREVRHGTAMLAEQAWLTGDPPPFDECLAELNRWLSLTAQHHPHQVPQQLAAAESTWAFLQLLARQLSAETAQADRVTLATTAARLIGFRAFGATSSAPAAEAAQQAVNLWAVAGPDPRLPTAEAWAHLAGNQHRIGATVADDRAAELAAQRASAARAAAIAYPLVDVELTDHENVRLATVLNMLVGLTVWGTSDSLPAEQAAAHAVRVWERCAGDRRLEIAEVWRNLAGQHHEAAAVFHGDAVTLFAAQRAAAGKSADVAFPLADQLGAEHRARLHTLYGALVGLLLHGLATSDPAYASAAARSERAAQLRDRLRP